MDASYWREYRKKINADPTRKAAYAAKSRERKARLRAIPGWRKEHEPNDAISRVVVYPPIPPLHTGHELFEEAKKFARHYNVGRPDRRVSVYNPYQEDAISEIVLAMLEQPHSDETHHVYNSLRRFRRKEARWTKWHSTGWLFRDFDDYGEQAG